MDDEYEITVDELDSHLLAVSLGCHFGRVAFPQDRGSIDGNLE